MELASDSSADFGFRTQLSRRQFIKGTTAAGVSLGLMNANVLAQNSPERKLNIGMIGCGKRATWISKFFLKHGGYNIAAAADYFPEQAAQYGDKFSVPANRRFTGLKCYERLLELKEIDAVVIKSPPFFHPEQAAAAVKAGKHVFLAKPISVDVPGCLSVTESGRLATEKKLVFFVDFQTRANEAYQEVVKRVESGAIGKIVSGESTYHCGPTWGHMDAFLRENPGNPEARLRAWGLDRVLSGDIITEQNIHVLDVATWFLNAAPLRAYGTGGAKRNFLGDCWDHFAVIYYFPNDVVVSFNSKQMGSGYDDLLCRMYGTSGTVETHYAGKIQLRGQAENNFDGASPGLYETGAVGNIATFHNLVTRGICDNMTIAPSVRSNLTTILGRMAAYTKREVTWEEMMQANERWSFNPAGLKA